MEFRLIPKLPSARPKRRNDPCPCGGGMKWKKCCMEGVRSALRKPPEPKTGHVNSGCYAAPLADCCEKLSKEHVVPRAILNRLLVGATVKFENPIIGAGARLLTPQAVTARVLCKRHNNAASELDAIGLGFFTRLEELFRRGLGDKPEPAPSLFNGFDLERWLLKVTAGCVASGWGGMPREVPHRWLEIIWGEGALGVGEGFFHVSQGSASANLGFRVAPIVDAGDPLPIGGTFEMFGMKVFIIAAGGRPMDPRFDAVNRPPGFISEINDRLFPTDLEFGPLAGRRSLMVSLSGKRDPGPVPNAWDPV